MTRRGSVKTEQLTQGQRYIVHCRRRSGATLSYDGYYLGEVQGFSTEGMRWSFKPYDPGGPFRVNIPPSMVYEIEEL